MVRRARLCRISEQHQGDRFGELLGECVVKDQRVISPLVVRYIVGTLDDLVRFALANPLDLLEADTGQLFDDRGSGASGSTGRRQVLARIGTVIVAGGMISRTEDTGMAWMLEDAKVERFLVRLNTPGDGMVGLDIDPSDKVRLSARNQISMCD